MINVFETVEEVKKMEEWKKDHLLSCSIKYFGAVGGRFTYSFTPTSLGMICNISCACGEVFDATDYDEW